MDGVIKIPFFNVFCRSIYRTLSNICDGVFCFVLSYKNLRDIKDTLVLVFSCVFCEIFKSKLSREHLPGDCFCKFEKVCFRNQVFKFA